MPIVKLTPFWIYWRMIEKKDGFEGKVENMTVYKIGQYEWLEKQLPEKDLA